MAVAYGTPPSSPMHHVARAMPDGHVPVARGLLFDGLPHPRPHKTDTYVRIERSNPSASNSVGKKRMKRMAKKRRSDKRQEWADEGIFSEEDSLVDIIADEVGIDIPSNASPAFKRSSANRYHAARSHSQMAKRLEEAEDMDDEWMEHLSQDLPYGDAVLSSEDFLEQNQDLIKRAKPSHHHHHSTAEPSAASGSGSPYGASTPVFVGMAGSAVVAASGMPSASGSASASASQSVSSTPPGGSKWINGATGLMYAALANGSSTVVTSASNVYVVQGGGDTSNGDPLMTQIMTQKNATQLTELFWLLDTTGDFCNNNATNQCFITLGDGYNDSPYSLVPYDLSLNDNVKPIPMWSINATTGELTGTWANKTAIQFTQNDMLEGNGDIDASPKNETVSSGFLPVTLYLQ